MNIRLRKQQRISKTFTLERRAFWVLLFLIITCAGLYIFFIESAIVHVVRRENIENNFRSLRTDLLTMESDYYAKASQLTLDDARTLGLVVVPDKQTQFVAVGNDGKMLTYQSH